MLERTKAYRFTLDEDAGYGEAVCARIGVRDNYGDQFMPGAFDSEIGKTVPLLAAHSVGPNPPLGTIQLTAEQGSKVMGKFALNETSLAQEWRTAAKAHGVELSVRVRFKDSAINEVDIGGGRIGWDIAKVKLMEVSLAGLGMQPGTGTSRVKADTLNQESATLLVHRSIAMTNLKHRSLSGGSPR